MPALAVGLVSGLVSLLVGKAVLGTRASGLTWGEGVRGAVGCGLYLALMALFAAGLTALLRSAVATLGILVPFLLIVSFVIGGVSGGAADFLPETGRAKWCSTTWTRPRPLDRAHGDRGLDGGGPRGGRVERTPQGRLTARQLSEAAALLDLMTIARHLATIDRLCYQDFPLEHGGSSGSTPGDPVSASSS